MDEFDKFAVHIPSPTQEPSTQCEAIAQALWELLSDEMNMEKEGIKPNKYGFVTLDSVWKTTCICTYQYDEVEHSAQNSSNLFILRNCPSSGKTQIKLIQPDSAVTKPHHNNHYHNRHHNNNNNSNHNNYNNKNTSNNNNYNNNNKNNYNNNNYNNNNKNNYNNNNYNNNKNNYDNNNTSNYNNYDNNNTSNYNNYNNKPRVTRYFTPHDQPSRQHPPNHNHPKKQFGTKNWIGFPVSHSSALVLQNISQILGKRIQKFHFSIGWCKTSQKFYDLSCGTVLFDIRKICTEISDSFQLNFSHFQIMGKNSDKITAVYDPIPTKEGSKFSVYSERILNTWRNAGKDFAELSGSEFDTFTNNAGSLEFGRVKNRIIYEMRAIPIKFHVTLGTSESDFWQNKISGINLPVIELDPTGVYMSAGKATPFSAIN